MKFCTNCGAKLPDESKFCTECGTKLEAPPPTYDDPSSSVTEPASVPPTSIGTQEPAIPPMEPAEPPNPVPPADPSPSEPHKPAKKKARWPAILLVVILILAAAGAALLFLSGSSDDEPDEDSLDSPASSSSSMAGENNTTDEESPEEGGSGLAAIADKIGKLDVPDESEQTGSTSEPVSDEDMELQPPVEYSQWAGDWYGWIVYYNTSESLADLEDSFLAALCTITVNEDGTGRIAIQDSEQDVGEVFAYADVSFGPGTTPMGCMISEQGSFMGDPLEHGDWIIDPGSSSMDEYEQMLVLEGTCTDEEDEDTWIEYYIFLRPWGMEWEDVRNGNMNNKLYQDMMPYGYDDWYIPLLEAGVTKMPDSFQEGLDMLENQ